LEVTVVRGVKDYFAITKPSSMSQDWVTRRPRRRAFFHPAAIFPKLSRALVNLSRVKRGEVFLDPFCGTGSLLLEAYEVGAVPLGSDIDSKMVRGASRNMAGFDQSWLGVVRADAGQIPLGTVDAISTDVPYGRASSTSGSDTRHIMDTLVANASSLLRGGHRLVLMHPRSVQVEGGSALELEEEHQLYIHRKLTRTISVLRRV
jgi:tRNA (guanine10-N2)-dimethyltransferase